MRGIEDAEKLVNTVSKGRVAFFLPTLAAGGAETVMTTIAKGLADTGWHVDIVAGRAAGPLLERLGPTTPLIDLQVSRTRAAVPRLARYLRRRQPDILVSTLSHANIIALLSQKLARVRTAVIVRQANVSPERSGMNVRSIKNHLFSLAQGLSYRMANCVVAPSEGVAEDMVTHLALPKNRIRMIYNPVDIDSLRTLSAAPAQHPWFDKPDAPIVLAAGRLVSQKDFPTLITAFAQLTQRRPAKLIILGEGEQRPRLQQLIRALRMDEVVDLPGYVANPYSYMARSSLFVLSSRSEGMPNALIEALALGCKIVATDCKSGPREVLKHGKYGALVPVGDAAALSRAMAAALDNDPTLFDEDPIERFSMKACLNSYETIFRSLLRRQSSAKLTGEIWKHDTD